MLAVRHASPLTSAVPLAPSVPAPLRLRNSAVLADVDCVQVMPNSVASSVDARTGGADGAVQRAAVA